MTWWSEACSLQLQPEAVNEFVGLHDKVIRWFTPFEFRMSDVSLRTGHSFDHFDQVPRLSKAISGHWELVSGNMEDRKTQLKNGQE